MFKETKVFPVQLDVSNPDEVRRLPKSLPKEAQDIDILVNNAYLALTVGCNCRGLVRGMEHVGEISEEDIRVMFDTNVMGLINVRLATPLFSVC